MDSTTPDMGVATPSIEDRMQAFVNREEAATTEVEESPPQAEAAEQDAPQDQAQTDEVTADDLPDETPEPSEAGETVFDLVVDGKPIQVRDRAEQIKYMQQGLHYTQSMQALAREREVVQANVQRSQEMVKFAPLVAQDLATVKAFEAQLQQYSKVDWVALATNDPLEYPKYRAQYDQLANAHQQAVAQFRQNAGALQNHQSALAQQSFQSEATKLAEVVPEWSNAERYQKEAPEMARFLMSKGFTSEVINSLGSNPGDAQVVALARDAWLYNRLKADKAGKVKQLRTVPPMPKPGAPSAAGAEQALKARELHKKVGTRASAAGLLLSRMK